VRDLKGNHADMGVSRAACGALFSEAEVLELVGVADSGSLRAFRRLAGLYPSQFIILGGTQMSAGLSAVRAVFLHKRAVVLHSRAVARHVPFPSQSLRTGSMGCSDLLVISPRLSPGVVRWVSPGEADF
jgi:hypothetical protein